MEKGSTSELNSISACELGALPPQDSNHQEADCSTFNGAATQDGITTGSEFQGKDSRLNGTNTERETRGGSCKYGGKEAVERRYKLWLRAEIVGLCILILIVWGLLLLPIVFYHQPFVSLPYMPRYSTVVEID